MTEVATSAAPRPRLGWAAAMAVALLFAAMVVAFHLRDVGRPMLLDFTNFWATGRLALGGEAAAAYDPAALAAAQAAAVGPTSAVMPYPYPPAFMLVTAPFALLDYHFAFALWVVAGFALFLWAGTRMAPAPLVAAQPAVLINGMIGQTGFLTGAILLAGARLLGERPFRAGLLLGLLVLKPQLALMLPVAVIAARAWPAIGGALLSALVLLGAGLVAFGADSTRAFLAVAGEFDGIVGGDRLSWNELASPFGLLRDLGGTAGPAMVVQLACAGFAAVLCWKSWREGWAQRGPILCTASLVASPYLQSYDTLPMLAAIAWFRPHAPVKALALYLFCLVPVASQSDLVALPNSLPAAALLALALLWHERRQDEADQITPTRLPAASNMPRISPT